MNIYFYFTTGGDVDDTNPTNQFVYGLNERKYINLGNWIAPKKHLHKFIATWDNDREGSYYEYFPKEYGFYLFDNHFNILFGHQSSDWSRDNKDGLNSKKLSLFIPWNETTSKSIATEDEFKIDMKDFDGTKVEAIIKLKHHIHTKGYRSFSWLKYFTQDLHFYRIDAEFSAEVGKAKGSWKGGTHAISWYIGNTLPDNWNDEAMSKLQEMGLKQ